MIGKLIITAIVLGSGAFLLLSDNFEEYISPYANAAASDIEDIKMIQQYKPNFTMYLM